MPFKIYTYCCISKWEKKGKPNPPPICPRIIKHEEDPLKFKSISDTWSSHMKTGICPFCKSNVYIERKIEGNDYIMDFYFIGNSSEEIQSMKLNNIIDYLNEKYQN